MSTLGNAPEGAQTNPADAPPAAPGQPSGDARSAIEPTQPIPARVQLTNEAQEGAGEHSGFEPPAPPLDAPLPVPARSDVPAVTEEAPVPFTHPDAPLAVTQHVLLLGPEFDEPGLGHRLAGAGMSAPAFGPEGATWQQDGHEVRIRLCAEPFRRSTIEEAVRGNRAWRDGALALREQEAYLSVTVAGGTDPVARLVLLTRVVAAVLADETSIGVHVPAANRVIDPVSYLDSVARLDHGMLPTADWVAVVSTPAEGEGSRGWTQGLASVGHCELEVLRSPLDVSSLYSALGRLTDYVVSGHALYPGDTLTAPDGRVLHVVASDSVLCDGPTLKIDL